MRGAQPSAGAAPERGDTAPSYLLPLLQLCDSALPTGGFSHSFGMETYLASGIVHDERTFADWLRMYITHQLVYCDGLAVRLTYDAQQQADGDIPGSASGLLPAGDTPGSASGLLPAGDIPGSASGLLPAGDTPGSAAAAVADLDRALVAQALPQQIRDAAATMGRRMVEIGQLVTDAPALAAYRAEIDAGRCAGHPAVAYALVAHAVGAPLPVAIEAFLFATASSLTQNAVRGIPIGQNAGQRVQRGTHPIITAAVARVLRLTPEDLGAVAPGLEIAQMRHQRQRARMFMS